MSRFFTRTGRLTQALRDTLEGKEADLTPRNRDIIETCWKMFDCDEVSVYHGNRLMFVGIRGQTPSQWTNNFKPDDAPGARKAHPLPAPAELL